MSKLIPKDPNYEKRIRESFSKQGLLQNFDAEIVQIAPGEVELAMHFDKRLTQQDGFLHAGAITTLVDSACGYAAYTLMPADSRVLSVEFKINYLTRVKPGDLLVGTGEIDFTGAKLIVASGNIVEKNSGRLVAKGIGTFSQYPLSKKLKPLEDLGTEEVGDAV